MKTLGIFGDSFASISLGRPTSAHTAWPNQLDKSRWQVTNYALASTNFYWTYRLFLEHHSKYDQVVCIVTRPGRITLRNEPYVLGIPVSITGIRSAEWLLTQPEHTLPSYLHKSIEIIRDYLMHVQDYEYEVDANNQLFEHLRRERPDAIFIPMTKVLPSLRPPEYTNMLAFTRLIVTSLKPELVNEFFNDRHGGDGWIHRDELDTMQCHMTPEVNALMARCVEEALTTGVWAPQLPEYVHHSLAWEDYFKPTSRLDGLFKKFK